MPFYKGATMPMSAIGRSQQLRRQQVNDPVSIAEALHADGFSPEEIADATGIPLEQLGLDPSAEPGMAPNLDPTSPDSFGVMQDDMADDESSPWDKSPWSTDEESEQTPLTVEQGIDQQIDPLGTKAAQLAEDAMPTPRPTVSVLEGGAGKRLAEEVAKQQAAQPEPPPPDTARIASLLTEGAAGGVPFDKASTENPDPSIVDVLKGAGEKVGGKVKDIFSAIMSPSDAAAQAMMSAGLGMMGAQGTYGSTMSAIGQGGAEGIKTYQTAKRREDVAKAKADQLKSLEKRADENIKLKREELAGKTSAQASKDADAKEKRLAAKLTQLRMLAAQGNTAEARDIFSKDPELQEYLHRKDLAFDRGSSWIKGGAGSDGPPKSMDGWRARIFDDMRNGRPVSEHDVEVFLEGQNDNATREAFQAMIRLQETRDGQKLFRNMTHEQVLQWVVDKAEMFRKAESAGKRNAYGITGGPAAAPAPAPGGFDVRGLRDGGATAAPPKKDVNELLGNYKRASGGS